MKEVTLPAIRRGLQDIKTVGRQINRLPPRTPQGALVEMATLVTERERIQVELARSKRRAVEMRARLREIRQREQCLSQFTRLRAAPLRPDEIDLDSETDPKKPNRQLQKESRFAEMTLQY